MYLLPVSVAVSNYEPPCTYDASDSHFN